jgi:hypothetical protein
VGCKVIEESLRGVMVVRTYNSRDFDSDLVKRTVEWVASIGLDPKRILPLFGMTYARAGWVAHFSEKIRVDGRDLVDGLLNQVATQPVRMRLAAEQYPSRGLISAWDAASPRKTTPLHDAADPLRQCGYCAGWTHEELWSRIHLVGDVHCGVSIRCRECGYQGMDLAYLGWHPPDGIPHVMSVAELLRVGEQHVITVHAHPL